MDYLLVKNAAQKVNLSMSEFMLKSGLSIKLETKFSKEEIELFRKLTGMANNLNQVARRLNSGESLSVRCLKDLDTISQILNQFK
jgi:hypothetical protein